VVEVEARRELVRQADELKAQLDDQRAEANRVKEISAHQAKEVAELRTQWSQLQERLTAREAEVSRLSAQVLEPLAPDAARQARIGELEQQLGEATEEKERCVCVCVCVCMYVCMYLLLLLSSS
jgi:predicted nuclease with TOPRIM domain